MQKHVSVQLLAAAVLVAVAAVPSPAGIRGPTRKDNALSINGHGYGRGWSVNAPLLYGPDGYLTYDVTGKSPKVTFQKEKGPGAEWAFVEVKPWSNTEGKGMRDGWYISEEQEGYSMKLQATEGPFKGWYLRWEKDGLVVTEKRLHSATLELLEKTTESKGR
jgi:hypothetical protein